VVIEIIPTPSCQHLRSMSALFRFGPPLAVMAVIFVLSAQPDLNSGLGVWDTILRKLGHAAEYGLLWWLWWRAFGYRRAGLAAAIVLAYAASDEIHQSFVTGRNGSPVDWLIDAAGVTLAALAVAISARASNRRVE
jgi:VanZ family protein